MDKNQLNRIQSLLGLLGGISLILAANGYIPNRLGQSISGVSILLIGTFSQKPATEHPTTEDLEQ